MKYILLTAILAAGMGTSLMSCNNGDYLADPQGNIPNPPGLHGGVEEGILSCTIDSMHRYFRYGMWMERNGTQVLTGMITKNGRPVESITITIGDFTGPATYFVSDSTLGNSITYMKLDADTTPVATYLTQNKIGYGAIVIESSDGNIQGFFSGNLLRTDSVGEPVHVNQGRFNLAKFQ